MWLIAQSGLLMPWALRHAAASFQLTESDSSMHDQPASGKAGAAHVRAPPEAGAGIVQRPQCAQRVASLRWLNLGSIDSKPSISKVSLKSDEHKHRLRSVASFGNQVRFAGKGLGCRPMSGLGHLDDVCPVVCQQSSAEVAGHHLTQVQHL